MELSTHSHTTPKLQFTAVFLLLPVLSEHGTLYFYIVVIFRITSGSCRLSLSHFIFVVFVSPFVSWPACVIQQGCQLLRLYIVRDERMSMNSWWNDNDREEPKNSEINLSAYHFVYQKSQTNETGIVTWPPPYQNIRPKPKP